MCNFVTICRFPSPDFNEFESFLSNLDFLASGYFELRPLPDAFTW